MWGVLTLAAVLLAAPGNSGKLSIDYRPTNATVKVDGKTQKKVKSGRAFVVKAGKRRIEVRRKGYASWQKTVVVKAGQTLKLKVRLKKTGKRKKTPVVAAGGKKGGKAIPGRRPPPKRKPAKRPPKRKGSGLSPRDTPRNKNPKALPTQDRDPKKRPAKRPAKRPKKRPRKANKPAAAPVAPAADTRQPDGRTNYKAWAVGAYIVSGLAFTGGIMVGLAADEKAEEFNDSIDFQEKEELRDATEIRALGANVLYGVAGTALLAGTVLWLMDDSDDYAASVVPTPDGGVMAGVGGRF